MSPLFLAGLPDFQEMGQMQSRVIVKGHVLGGLCLSWLERGESRSLNARGLFFRVENIYFCPSRSLRLDILQEKCYKINSHFFGGR